MRRNRGLFGLGMSLAVVPGSPSILWAAHQGGLYRSANAGKHWVRTALTPPSWGFSFYDIVPDPAAPSTDVYALCDGALWRTLDGGASWTDLFAGANNHHLVALRMGPEAAPRLWGSDEDRLLTSVDGGINWVPRAQPELGCGILDFAFAPSSASVMYMTGADGRWWNGGMNPNPPQSPNYCDDSPLPAFFRSDDGGTTWTDLSADLRLHLVQGAGRQIAVDPVDPRLIYLATMGGYESGWGDGVWKSTDGGATWERAGNGMKGQTVTAIVASPAAGVVWASAGGRIFRSGDAGATWKDRTSDLLVRRVYNLIVDPADPNRVYAATSAGVWVWEELDLR